MIKFKFAVCILLPVVAIVNRFSQDKSSTYLNLYSTRIAEFKLEQKQLIKSIENLRDISQPAIKNINSQLRALRLKLKAIDFWLRYLEPVTYKKINGPLPVEWETEVFEKFERPYKRQGAGLSLAQLYLNEPEPDKDSLLALLRQSDEAIETFLSDSISNTLLKPGNFFFANRLFLLNLAAIYTTGFECPDGDDIIEELEAMLGRVKEIYTSFNATFPSDRVTENYFQLYDKMEVFVSSGTKDFNKFDHYHFIRDYVNPLFAINQQMINERHFFSKNYNDYSVNNDASSIFDKSLYNGQNGKGIFIAVRDTTKLNEIKAIGKMLFFDPILSGNGKRSCASCHKPDEYFTDTTVTTGMAFNEATRLPRNTPSLLNVVYNHLLMLDGKHISLQNQAKDVITNPKEMGCRADEVVKNVMSCETYKRAFLKFMKLTPYYPELTFDHVVSSITLYYSDFSNFNAPFDRAMNGMESLPPEAIRGFNLFMSKAQCATCHFVPQFNGVKPPYIGSEFEVLGVPAGTGYKNLSQDSGRYIVNQAAETLHAFRTGTIRNSSYTKPYMHNGVFKTMDEVLDFYDAGGGTGKGLKLDNQTLATDSLRLTKEEKKSLKEFMRTLDENIIIQRPPAKLPPTKLQAYKNRKVGGEY